ncbi:MAG TPA: hypothetical protein PKY59_21565 [Pyrinomonadaceae bacterium]|nr:hypothetical protein [Pyrinomonadaceae bacterium]
MERILKILCLVVGLAMAFVGFPNGAISSLLVTAFALLIIFLIRKYAEEDKELLTSIFLIALLVRIVFGLFVSIAGLQTFFGADAKTYDSLGQRLVELWFYNADPNDWWSKRAMSTSEAGWGMTYLVGAIYTVTGSSILIAQSFCAVIGAATAPMVYFCAQKVFNNNRVAKVTAISIALFPSFIVWSSQLMKDGLIIFLLVVVMTMVLQLQQRFNLLAVAVLILSMFGILSLRFYIFYMVAAAVAGSFVVGLGNTGVSILRRIAAVILIGLGLTYFGVLRDTTQIERYANLEMVQRSRQDLASSAESGFAEDVDVSTTEGAITTIPIGFLYLMLAPFPWQVTNVRQAITLPEILVWWAIIPLIISGSWYAVRHRLREAIPIIIFTVMLTLVYSVFQGNVGTAYRQRTQIQVFLFMFAGVGWALLQEKKENKQLVRQAARDRKLREIKALRERDQFEKPTQVLKVK